LGEPTFREINGVCIARVLPLRRAGKAQSIVQNVARGAIRVAAQHRNCGILGVESFERRDRDGTALRMRDNFFRFDPFA
jgi:hypothetical protein